MLKILFTSAFFFLAPSLMTIQNHQVSSFTTTRTYYYTLSPSSPSLLPNRCTTQIGMALTPVGPFCPFRSEAAIGMEPRVEAMNNATPNFAAEMARIQLDMQMGQTPEPERLKNVAKGINAAVDDWESLLTRLKISDDFRESAQNH